jgi:hypothetical protein
MVTKYVPGVWVLKFAVTAQLVPKVWQAVEGVKVGATKPGVATAVKTILSVLAKGQPFSANAVIVAPAGAPLTLVIIVAFVVIEMYG